MLKAVLKIGGSLAGHAGLPELCRNVGKAARRHPLLVVPGGGPFADAVRDICRRFPISDSSAHWMAILGMEQYGMALADLIPRATRVTEPEKTGTRPGRASVLLPHAWLRRRDFLPHSWDVTSDSIAAFTATELGCGLCIFLKDRDGLYDHDPRDGDASLLPCMDIRTLADCRGVDRQLPAILAGSALNCWVINGAKPERLHELLDSGSTLGTRIRA
jgi:aspartokinase-like uncharacterized kinase